MAYKHGIYGSELATSLIPMTEVSAGLPVVFGTAPVHMASEAAPANTPVLCYKYSEAIAAFGYSEDWENYTLCEFMKSQFSLFAMAPVVFINVLNPAVHKKVVADKEVALSNKVGQLKGAVLLDTLEIKDGPSGNTLTIDADYTAEYIDVDVVEITAIEGGGMTALATVYASFNEVDASMVTAGDIVGGVDTITGVKKGLEMLDEVYPRFGLIPGIILAPGWSNNSSVTATMVSKSTKINGRFKAICLADIPTEEVVNYTKASEWKASKNFNSPHLVACWPKVAIDGVSYHMSTQLAGVLCTSDANHDDVPYWSPSNQSLKCDSAIAGDIDIFLDAESAAYLNGQGIVTAINQGGWMAWGNRTSCYPNNTDVKDAFIPVRRMFCWISNTLITSFWSKIDNPINKRLIATVVDSANIWLNGLAARGYLLGGRVEFREDENTTTDLMDGKMNFHVYITPPSPAREINFIHEYDVNYISTLFD